MAVGLSRAHFELDIYEVLDKNFPSSVNLADMREKFQDTNSLHFVFKGQDGIISAGEVCKLESFFRAYANGDSRVQSWFSPWRIRHPNFKNDRLLYPTLLENPCSLPSSHPIENDLSLLAQTPWSLLLTDKKHQQFSINVNFRDEETKEGRKHFNVAVISDLACLEQ